ncbi:hypothetical protein ACN4EK_13675 [Pantanalinema rosaneae CENA516]|uniref:hypothetical protein n=1 Tax=Pantanalinema rosaneae TaxID=1620701 RepID=UPI003D6FFCC6
MKSAPMALSALSSLGSVAVAALLLLLAIQSFDPWKPQQTVQSSITGLDLHQLTANTPSTNSAPGGREAAGRR